MDARQPEFNYEAPTPMRSVDLHWLAGLLEGEGSFCQHSKPRQIYPMVQLEMTDRDIIVRAATMLGGRLREKQPRLRKKPTFTVTVRCYRASLMMRILYPLLGVRRQARIKAILGNLASSPCRLPTEDESLHWLAGLLEGEGWFGEVCHRGTHYPAIELHMTDQDVVERAAVILGRSTDHRQRASHLKPIFRTRIAGQMARHFMKRLFPYMGLRRQEKISSLLSRSP